MDVKNVTVVNESLFETYCAWLGRTLTRGISLAKYKCPHCESDLYSSIPPVGDVTDTLITCPVCAELSFKVVDNKSGDPVVTVQGRK